jgi:Ca2+/Na+ antiporter
VNQLDLAVMLLATFMVLPLLRADEKKRRAIGVALLVGYGLYLSHLLGRSFSPLP